MDHAARTKKNKAVWRPVVTCHTILVLQTNILPNTPSYICLEEAPWKMMYQYIQLTTSKKIV